MTTTTTLASNQSPATTPRQVRWRRLQRRRRPEEVAEVAEEGDQERRPTRAPRDGEEGVAEDVGRRPARLTRSWLAQHRRRRRAPVPADGTFPKWFTSRTRMTIRGKGVGTADTLKFVTFLLFWNQCEIVGSLISQK
uniref:(northern house mosquito) hypothetical protein n=1 Tax=Culex pipiens TaxID=7175 RepID=A0A8D8DX16_CULPI